MDVIELLAQWERSSAHAFQQPFSSGGAKARVHRGAVHLPDGVLPWPESLAEEVPQSVTTTRDGRWCLVTASTGGSELSRLHILRRNLSGSTPEVVWTVPGRGSRGRPAVLDSSDRLGLWIAGEGQWRLITLEGEEVCWEPVPAISEGPGVQLLSARGPRRWWVVASTSAGVRLDAVVADPADAGGGLRGVPGPVFPGLRSVLEVRAAGDPALLLHQRGDEHQTGQGAQDDRLSLLPIDGVESSRSVFGSLLQPLWQGPGLRSYTVRPGAPKGLRSDRLLILCAPRPGESELLQIPLMSTNRPALDDGSASVTPSEPQPEVLARRRSSQHGEVLRSVRVQGDQILVSCGSQVRPERVTRMADLGGGVPQAKGVGPGPVSGVAYATSDDGVEVPYTWHALEGIEAARRRRAPVMLTVYGGFGVELGEGFDPSARAWCDSGGVHVTAHVRGGGELGTTWHRAGAGRRKHRAVEDLIAVASRLRADFPAGRLTVVGASMGGVLAAAAAARIPGLFNGAVVSAAPVDLSRLEQNPLGHRWRQELLGEEGPGVPSPSRHLVCPTALWRSRFESHVAASAVDRVLFPQVLAIVQENDSRVESAHLRELISLMQDHGVESELRVNPGAGHGRNTAEAVHRYAAWILGFCRGEQGS